MAYTTIDDPSAHFQTTLYTGNGGTLAVTNSGNSDLQPDWVWIKSRPDARDHQIYDSVRGVTKVIGTDRAAGEATVSNGLTAFGSDGFTVGSDANVNDNGDSHVAWCWKAGGSASSNSDGNLTSSVSANTTAGFSIVTTTGTGSAATIGHGLNGAPAMIFGKRRDSGSSNWRVFNHKLSSNSHILFCDTDSAEQSGNSGTWNNTAPTSSVFSVGDSGDVNASSGTFVFYCFQEIKGYCKIGSYRGNGSNDGSHINTGFKPAFVLIKRTDSSTSWQLIDNKRSNSGGNNIIDEVIAINSSDAEYDEGSANWFADFTSNGFKLRNALGAANTNNAGHIYMAIAESPFVTSTGVPTTAR